MSFDYSYNLPWSSDQTEVRNYQEIISQDASTGVYKVADTLTDTPFGMAGSWEYAGTVTVATDSTTKVQYPISGTQWFLPASWNLNTGMSSEDSYQGVTDNADGTIKLTLSNSQHFGITVIKQEAVSVPLGSYTCWKTTQIATYQSNAMKTVNSTCWWAPQLGAPVMMDTVEENTTGSGTSSTSNGTRTLHYELISTTVPNAGLTAAFLAKNSKVTK